MSEHMAFRLLDSVEIPMRDGCVLRADIWLPDGEGAWPVLLQRTPYRKEDAFGTQYISALDFRVALRRGYAIVVQDTRGRYSSDGQFVPFSHEIDDGADTLEWLRRQDFCNGEVAMFGASYVGATQVLAAAGNPPGLKAISPHLSTARHGETWTYRSGAVELGFLLLWIIESLGPEDLNRRLANLSADAAARATRLLEMFRRDPQSAFERLPVIDDDLLALAPYAADWFNASRAASAAADREHLDALSATRLPMLVSCGWNDLFLEGALELFETARNRWTSPDTVPDRLIIGPWSHGNPSDWQGDFWLGYPAATAGLSDCQLDFFDAARVATKPASPVVQYFRTGTNSWHAAPDWPLPGTQERTFFLGPDGLADAVPAVDWSLSYVSDTLNPVPSLGGANFLPGLLQGRNSGPKDQAGIESRDDLVLFTSAPLAQGTEITGLVEAIIWVSSTGQSADWTARLCEVDVSGRSIGLVDGICRQPMAGGEVTIRLGHISHLLRRGSRLRLQIASSNFPRFDRNPQSGMAPELAQAADFVPATQTIHGGAERPSRLLVATIPEPFPTVNGFR
ncbi:esterase [Devosia yakushimensis]|uniref:Esterase n=1 Tax=Devosia yakushimensis TaxID=470028 RepID=A0ABQ5UIY0_9HYPH|nr:CocE/NonD family hydrolase [Devosia yakushimensis]GLQ11421.1 esterase [Devosia yakushimensis]